MVPCEHLTKLVVRYGAYLIGYEDYLKENEQALVVVVVVAVVVVVVVVVVVNILAKVYHHL